MADIHVQPTVDLQLDLIHRPSVPSRKLPSLIRPSVAPSRATFPTKRRRFLRFVIVLYKASASSFAGNIPYNPREENREKRESRLGSCRISETARDRSLEASSDDFCQRYRRPIKPEADTYLLLPPPPPPATPRLASLYWILRINKPRLRHDHADPNATRLQRVFQRFRGNFDTRLLLANKMHGER